MIFRETVLRVADNSGARLVRCVGLGLRRVGYSGDIVTVSVSKCRPNGRVERGRLYRALVVQCRSLSRRWGGVYCAFRSNRVVLLKRSDSSGAEVTPLGTRFLRPLSQDVRKRHGFARVLSLAPALF